MRLEARTVVVTGGASGLGGATVDMIVAAGGRAVIVDINEQAGAAKAAQYGKSAHFVKTDVTSDTEMQRAVDAGVKTFGAIHGLVCAAGIAVAERVLPKEGVQPLAHFTRTITVNLIGTFNAIRLTVLGITSSAHLPLRHDVRRGNRDGGRKLVARRRCVNQFEDMIRDAAPTSE